MDARSIVARADKLGITLWADGELIKYSPKSRAPSEFLETLKALKPEILAYLSQPPEALSPETQLILAWASELSEENLVLDAPVKFVEAPLRTITTDRVSSTAARYLSAISFASLHQTTGGWGRWTAEWWKARQEEAVYALTSLKRALEDRA